MTDELLDVPVRELLDRVTAETPTPGGGSVAALVAALAAGLVEAVARGSGAWTDGRGLAAQAKVLRERVEPLAQRDAEAYEHALVALRLPETLEPEVRSDTIERSLSYAAEVPLAIALIAADVAEAAAAAAEGGDASTCADASVAAVLAESAARGAAHLVAVNLTTTESDDRVVRARRAAEAAGDAARRALRVAER
jgi:glutamate formiminotransferase/formiminotetrahydrofolate cyclodeaminase